MSELNLDVQYALPEGESASDLPAQEVMQGWALQALQQAGYHKDAEITLRFVGGSEIQELNRMYRHIDRETNILSFPFDEGDEQAGELSFCDGVHLNLLGDLVVCVSVLRREAAEQHKTLHEHLCHLIVHGCLHLLGFDHIEEPEAEEMEALETKVVMSLGYKDPYTPLP